jgi:hypothetical protein
LQLVYRPRPLSITVYSQKMTDSDKQTVNHPWVRR